MKNIIFVVKGCFVVLLLIGWLVLSVASGISAFVIFADPEFPEIRLYIVSGFISFLTVTAPIAVIILISTIPKEHNNNPE